MKTPYEIWLQSARWFLRRRCLKSVDDGQMMDRRTDGQTTDDGRRRPTYRISSPMSLRLRWAKTTGSKKLRSKFETLRREIKDDVRQQHDLYVNNLVGDVKANLWDFYRYINSPKKKKKGLTIKVFRPLKEEEERVSQLQKLNWLRNLMVSLRSCSTKMIIVRSHFSVGRPPSWMTLLFQKRV